MESRESDILGVLKAWCRVEPIAAPAALRLDQDDWERLAAAWRPRLPHQHRAILNESDLRPVASRRDRRSQAGGYYKEYFEGGAGFRPNDTARDFLRRQGARPADPVDPKLLSYS